MTRLMDCIVAMPSPAGRRARDFITKVENAKKTPAINPLPSAATSVRTKINGHLQRNIGISWSVIQSIDRAGRDFPPFWPRLTGSARRAFRQFLRRL
jgi:hypothetical protein